MSFLPPKFHFKIKFNAVIGQVLEEFKNLREGVKKAHNLF
jgi:hypothetical protein